MHHTRQMIVDAIQGAGTLTLRLGDGDTTWTPVIRARNITGPGLVTYRRTEAWEQMPYAVHFDPLAADHDPRCDAVNPGGDVCRLLAGDHPTHYWGETDE